MSLRAPFTRENRNRKLQKYIWLPRKEKIIFIFILIYDLKFKVFSIFKVENDTDF